MDKENMNRESFVFYKSFYDAINETDKEGKPILNDSEKLTVYKMICEYALFGETMQAEGIIKIIFSLVKPQIDANNKRYLGGKKGGRPSKKVKDLQQEDEKTIGSKNKNHRLLNKKPMVLDEKTIGLEKTYGFEEKNHRFFFEKPNDNVNENENGNVNGNENENGNENGNDYSSDLDDEHNYDINEDLKEIIKVYEKCGYQINGHSAEILKSFLNDYPLNWITRAIEISAEYNKYSLKYIEAILNNWKNKGVIDDKRNVESNNESDEIFSRFEI